MNRKNVRIFKREFFMNLDRIFEFILELRAEVSTIDSLFFKFKIDEKFKRL